MQRNFFHSVLFLLQKTSPEPPNGQFNNLTLPKADFSCRKRRGHKKNSTVLFNDSLPVLHYKSFHDSQAATIFSLR